jgi:NAD(P) transhydrogenase subunit beta
MGNTVAQLNPDLVGMAYLIATLFFIYGLKGLSSPKTALLGNASAMTGMGLAFAITLAFPSVGNYGLIFAAIASGAVIGIVIARKIKMTAMPQLVACLHSFVGITALLVALGTFLLDQLNNTVVPLITMIELTIGSFVGAITFAGSIIAFGKLQGILSSKPLIFKHQHFLNLVLTVAIIVLGIEFLMHHNATTLVIIDVIALILGFLLVVPIGGADMPVVISMHNSYSGWAAAATGFVLNNQLLITTGALVGSSGAILSYIMCHAMNRELYKVMSGGVGLHAVDLEAMERESTQAIKAAAVEDVAFLLENASSVIIVPGYGMAVAQAHHAIKELYDVLTEKGVSVKFAIHPVAGRMPGHMNVLLAESDIPYDVVFTMDEINKDFAAVDVAFVIGANDVVNPAAKNVQSSPIYGMPILEVYKAKQVLVSKRSMKPGYSGIDNALFEAVNCSLVFGDAKHTCEMIVKAIRGAA